MAAYALRSPLPDRLKVSRFVNQSRRAGRHYETTSSRTQPGRPATSHWNVPTFAHGSKLPDGTDGRKYGLERRLEKEELHTYG